MDDPIIEKTIPISEEQVKETMDFNERITTFKKQRESQIASEDPDWAELAREAELDTMEVAKEEGMIEKYPIITSKELLAIEFPPQQWIIDRFLPEGGITMLVGEAGTLKSYISLYIAKTLLTGEKLFGEFETHRKCKILLVDKENKLPRIQRRIIGLGGHGSPDMWIIKSPETFILEDKKWVEYVRNFIIENKIDVVILDSFIDFFTGNENSSTDTAMAMNAIRSLSQTCQYILIHHDSKPIPKMVRTAGQKTRGSSNIIAQVDTQFYFEKGKDNRSLLIEQGKSRDEEPLKKFEVGIVSEVDKGISDFVYKGEIQDEVTMINQSKEVIYQFIKDHPSCTKDDINIDLELNGITPRTGKNGLLALMKENLIDYAQKPGHGRKHFYFVMDAVEGQNDDENEEDIP